DGPGVGTVRTRRRCVRGTNASRPVGQLPQAGTASALGCPGVPGPQAGRTPAMLEGRAMTARVAINGLGRIGRATLKLVLDEPALELVAINDIAPPDNLAYLLKYDTVYGRYEKSVEAADGSLVIDG